MTTKGPSPLLGYNTNVRHKGVLCHVQTEDSGVGHPHVITHLFTAGTIIATKKRSYAEHVGSTDIEVVVRKVMQEQHKQMCIELRDGAFDQALEVKDTQETALVGEAFPTPPDQAPPTIEVPPPVAEARPPIDPPRVASPPAPPPIARRVKPPLPQLPEDVPSEIHLAREEGTPPPPSAVRAKPAPPAPTTYTVRTPAPPVRGGKPVPTPSPAAGRYSSRVPGLFGGARTPTPRPPEKASIFGQEHISEKSLDEVILAYLSEEADE
ncbi:MAG: hypothetical protein HYY06_29135 [Deltaproteobacteria bacterium]|nr:hypothetical protein [Deltaproteobacteria bacterium]